MSTIENVTAQNVKDTGVKKKTLALVALVMAVVSLILLICIQFIKVADPKGAYKGKYSSFIDSIITNYRLWLAGLIIGFIFAIVSLICFILFLVKKMHTEIAIAGIVICVVSIILGAVSFSKLSERSELYDAAIEYQDAHKPKYATETRHNHGKDDVFAGVNTDNL
ncbi:MAG: hypothetical protein J5752_04280 [Clostridiales bacterium]|nr:hypothetical protein [Clostridiales bacterium]